MKCPDCLDILHRRLDGELIASSAALEGHLAGCPSCRERHATARRLLETLRAAPRPTPPPDLAARVVASVLRDRQRRRIRLRRSLYVTAALAASILIMLLIAYTRRPNLENGKPDAGQLAHDHALKLDPAPPAPAPPPQEKSKGPEQQEPMKKPTREEEKPTTLATLTGRLADKTLDQAKVLWTAANPVEGMPVGELPKVPELDPQATQDASASLQAVSRSAQRAFAYFSRELPMLDLPPGQ